MSLLVLLTTGHSLEELRSGSRYHMTSQRLLPRFDVKRNPFRATTFPRPVQLTQAPLMAVAIQPEAVTVAPGGKTEAAAPAETRLVEAVSQVRPAPVLVTATPAAPRKSLVSRLWSRVSSIFAGTSRPAARSVRSAVKGPVQGELSLEKVKVMRNDLSDADLEIVPVRPTAAVVVAPVPAKAAVPAVPASASPEAPKRLNRLSTRLLSAMRL